MTRFSVGLTTAFNPRQNSGRSSENAGRYRLSARRTITDEAHRRVPD